MWAHTGAVWAAFSEGWMKKKLVNGRDFGQKGGRFPRIEFVRRVCGGHHNNLLPDIYYNPAATMANYDTPGLTYGSAYYFSPPPPPSTPKSMAKVKLLLNRITVAEKVALGRLFVTRMTNNANFTNPKPTLADITALMDDLEAKAEAQDAAQAAAKLTTAQLDTAEAEADKKLSALASWAEGHVEGDRDKLVSGGFAIQGEGGPVSVGQVTGLESSPGDDAGEVDLIWNPMPGATGYELQTSSDPNNPALWQHKEVASKSKITLGGLPTGARCWFRVRALGTNNQKGPWSNPADKVVP